MSHLPTLDVARAAIAPYLLAIKIGAAVLVLIAVAVLWWRVGVWHDAYRTLEATEKALETRTAEAQQCAARELAAAQAYREAAGKAKAKESEDRATAERIEHDLQTRLADADARGRDLARRLRDAGRAACPGGGAVSGAASVAGAVPDGREPGGDEEARRLAEAIRAAESDVFAACARDGETLSQVGPWYDEARERR